MFNIITVVLTSILSPLAAVVIHKIVVPDVVQSGTQEGAVLDCLYSVDSNQFTLQWLFNNSSVPVYRWRPGSEPVVSGLLDGRLDLAYHASASASEQRRALHIVALEPELSGDYTCKLVLNSGHEVQQTKSMLVFSAERDFSLNFHKEPRGTGIQCMARGVFPKPELTLEHDGEPFAKQQQRVWREIGPLFDTESTAFIPRGDNCNPHEVTCRLQLPQAGYAAMKKELVYVEGVKICRNSSIPPAVSNVLIILIYGTSFVI